ncbi:MAG: hypothetical protein ACI8Z1_002562, partial [Candidatus Azotimanducaceae bacterium]
MSEFGIRLKMNRRDFLRKAAIAGAVGMALFGGRLYGAIDGGHTGRVLVTIQADG